MDINYLDLFSGIGGFALGIQQAGIKFAKHYFSEIDKYATQITKRHFPNAIELGDINNIKPETLGKIDLITFGFPCQDLSIAGKRAGLGGARSGLFFKAMWLVRQLLPSVFIFENVKGLLTSNEGKDFEVVLREIADIGVYECEWQLVNTSWVLPQNRERIYFIGHLGERGGQKVFPITEGVGKNTSVGGGSINSRPITTVYAHGTGKYMDLVNTDISKTARGGGEGKSDKETPMRFSACLTPNRPTKRQNGRRIKNEDEPMFTLTGQDIHGIMICPKLEKSN